MSIDYAPTYIEQHARGLVTDLIRLLPGDGRYGPSVERSAVGAIAVGDYADARLLLGLEGHRGEAGDVLGAALLDLRGAKYATAIQRVMDYRLARDGSK